MTSGRVQCDFPIDDTGAIQRKAEWMFGQCIHEERTVFELLQTVRVSSFKSSRTRIIALSNIGRKSTNTIHFCDFQLID